MTPLAALLAGLTTGGLTCLAVQGGLLLGLLAQRDEQQPTNRTWTSLAGPIGAFLVAKILAYTLLGLGLGLIGSKLQLPLSARLWLQLAAGVFMVLSGIRLFYPRWLPWLEIRPPSSVRRFVRHSARAQTWFAPAVLGFLTVLIPCGTTQAMELAAITTGNALEAAAILFAFTLGTAPLFVVVGVLARGTAVIQRRLAVAAAAVVIGLGMYSINGVLIAIDSPFSAQNIVAALRNSTRQQDGTPTASAQVAIAVSANGYAPSRLTVPVGQEVRIALERKGALGCTSLFVIPKLSIQADISRGNKAITAVFPEPGTYRFTCGMGMYSGVIEAI